MKFIFLLSLVSTAFGHYAVIGSPLKHFHLENLNNQLSVEEAKQQERLFPGTIDAERAVTLAIKSFLTDPAHVESPLALSNDPDALYENMNQYSSEIRFGLIGEVPEQGELIEQNWIIRLKIPSLSDHIFWAIVDRQGKVPVYNYGFN